MPEIGTYTDTTLEEFLEEVITLLTLVATCRDVLFRRDIREPLQNAIDDATMRLDRL